MKKTRAAMRQWGCWNGIFGIVAAGIMLGHWWAHDSLTLMQLVKATWYAWGVVVLSAVVNFAVAMRHEVKITVSENRGG